MRSAGAKRVWQAGGTRSCEEDRRRMSSDRRQTDEESRQQTADDGPHLAVVAQLRQAAYRLFSTLLLYPDEERLAALATAAGELQDQSEFWAAFPFFGQWSRLLSSLQGLEEWETAKVQQQYVRLFMINPGGLPCLPYESYYVEPEGQATGWIAVQVEREYAAAGLVLAPSLKELPDHAAVELEFMAFLCHREACAWGTEVMKEGIYSLERQAAFLDRHLLQWFPEWARQVMRVDGDGIYTVVAEAAGSFVSCDRDLVSILLDRFQAVPKGTQLRSAHRVSADFGSRVPGSNHHGS